MRKFFGIGFVLVFQLAFINQFSFSQIIFQKIYGGFGGEQAFSVQQTFDSGYIMAGVWDSIGVASDIYLVKIDSIGIPQWTKIIETPGEGGASDVHQTNDGGYIIVGSGLATGNSAVYIIKTDSNGNVIWTRVIDRASYFDSGVAVQQTTDGGFIITGSTVDDIFFHSDLYLIKTDSIGNLLWTKIFGGGSFENENGHSVAQTNNGGFVIAGYTDNLVAGFCCVYLMKVDSIGNTIWSKILGGPEGHVARSLQLTNDGGFIICGWTRPIVNGRDFLS